MKQIAAFTVVFCLGVATSPSGAAAQPYGAALGTDVYGATAGAAIQPVGYDSYDLVDDSQRYSSGFERWWNNFSDCIRRRRLRGYKRSHSNHHKLLYPQCPPHCSPTFGYHHTQWRPFPQSYDYTWTTSPGQTALPTPVAEPALLPLTPTPQAAPDIAPELAPPAEKPYFPEAAPMIQPSNEAPPAPPAEPQQLPEVEVFLPARPAVEPAAYDLPVIMHIGQ